MVRRAAAKVWVHKDRIDLVLGQHVEDQPIFLASIICHEHGTIGDAPCAVDVIAAARSGRSGAPNRVSGQSEHR